MQMNNRLGMLEVLFIFQCAFHFINIVVKWQMHYTSLSIFISGIISWGYAPALFTVTIGQFRPSRLGDGFADVVLTFEFNSTGTGSDSRAVCSGWIGRVWTSCSLWSISDFCCWYEIHFIYLFQLTFIWYKHMFQLS